MADKNVGWVEQRAPPSRTNQILVGLDALDPPYKLDPAYKWPQGARCYSVRCIAQPILALVGNPVAGNPTQYMMEKAFAQHGLDCRFLTLEVAPDDLGDAVRGMRRWASWGGSVPIRTSTR